MGRLVHKVFFPEFCAFYGGSASTKAFFTTDTEWMGNGLGSRQPALGLLSGSYPCDPWLTGSESTKAFLPRIGSGWGMDGIRDNRSGVLSGSYLCDPWLMGSESTKAFFTTDGDRIGGRMGTKAAAEKMK